jgi:hypothetical protein
LVTTRPGTWNPVLMISVRGIRPPSPVWVENQP